MLSYSTSVRLIAQVMIAAILMPALQHLCGLADWGYEPRTEAHVLLVTERAPCHPEAVPGSSSSSQLGPSDTTPRSPDLSCCSFQVTAPITSPPAPEGDQSGPRLLLAVLGTQFAALAPQAPRPPGTSLADPPPLTRPAPYLFYAHLLI